MIKAAVIGHPIGHSKSPLIHNYWIKQHGLSGTYEAIDIAPQNLKSDIARLIDEGYAGFNATIPHKEALFELCDETDPFARRCKAVNTVVIKDGKLIGYNTDPFGYLANLEAHCPTFDYTGKTALIIGAGGAARSIAAGLIDKGIGKIQITNRTRERAKTLITDLGTGEIIDWASRAEHLATTDLIINTTSLGMSGQPPLDLDLTTLPQSAVVSDIVYAPLETDLLRAARMRGNQAVTGIGMLLHQARPAFEKWFGVMPAVDEELERLVLE
ncbi:MAG: shikimate dehydrogenase [Alphaproteobacteria bacterium]